MLEVNAIQRVAVTVLDEILFSCQSPCPVFCLNKQIGFSRPVYPVLLSLLKLLTTSISSYFVMQAMHNKLKYTSYIYSSFKQFD